MTVRRHLVLFAAAVGLWFEPALAQERVITVGAPAGVLVQLVQHLAPLFQAQTGIRVRSAATVAGSSLANTGLDSVLTRSRSSEADAVEHRFVFSGECVLVGSRADRARVRGLRDVRSALRWIAAARGTYVSSSPTLGIRDLELALWDSIGVNVRVRSTWYIETTADEAGVLKQAADLGAYALVERSTWAAQYDRRGLDVLVAGDPVLRTEYSSYLLRPSSQDARAWHDWLSSEQAQAAIGAWRLDGIQVFTPAGDRGGDGEARPPRT